MTFRHENTAAATAATSAPRRNRMRLALLGGAVAVLPVAGLVTATTASAASTATRNQVAQCESTGNWSIDTGNGFSGGLQFTPSTWAAYGGTAYAPTAAQATQSQQIAVAEKVLADQGPGAWPVCSVKAGLTAGGAPAAVDTGSAAGTTKVAPQQQAAPRAAAKSTDTKSADVKNTDAKSATGAKPAKAAKADQRAKASTGAGSYTVRSGDTLGAIAAAHGTTVKALFAANAQTIGTDADLILPGQVLSV
ncbi:resuscitation-promoting factor protein RpfA [Kitasatospora nipponensis]|uniref:Resuscitation-promoting factor protein RpfA n=1 Tax=Kitasatospora nipponensis TaxID=258049 RepID=A0ABP4H4L6_9ACTN